MAFLTGDLTPHQSGSASLGVEQINGMGGFTTEIRPYAHVHQNSGVWHGNPGQSGVIRFGLDANGNYAFEASLDGGLTYDTLPQSGQIQEAIAIAITPHTLQAAYDGGDQVNVDVAPLTGAAPEQQGGFRGPVIRLDTPGLEGLDADAPDANMNLNYGIAVSGHTATPENINSFAITNILPQSIAIKSSGTGNTIGSRGSTLFMGYDQGSPGFARILTSGTMLFGTVDVDGATSADLSVVVGGDKIETIDGFWTMNSDGAISINSITDSIYLSALGSATEYRDYSSSPHEAWHWFPSYESTGGPGGDGYHPIPHSGQIIQMIGEFAPGTTPHSLQAAYDGGNQADITFQDVGRKGLLVVNSSVAGRATPNFDSGLVTPNLDYYLAVSGQAGDPNNPHTYAIATLNPDSLIIQSSGRTIGSLTTQNKMFMGFNNGSISNATIATSGNLLIDAGGSFTNLTDDQWVVITGDSWDVTCNGNWITSVLGGGAFFGASNVFDMSAGTQVDISAWGGSGELTYQFGPHEAWHTTVGAGNTTRIPIPHSGHVAQMIASAGGGGGGAGTLQEAYEGGNHILATDAQGGPVSIAGTDTPALSLFVAENDSPHIIMSGLIDRPGANQNTVGALWMQENTAGGDAVQSNGVAVTSEAQADAISLGPATIFYNTGSGIVNLQVGSGVSQYTNGVQVTSITETATDFDTTLLAFPLDNDMFTTAVNNSGIRFNVPGAYRVSFNTTIRKNQGNLAQMVFAGLIIRDRFGNERLLVGMESAAIVRNSNSLSLNTMQSSAYGDFEVGETVFVRLVHSGIPPADNNVRVPALTVNVTTEYVGPKRFGKLNRGTPSF